MGFGQEEIKQGRKSTSEQVQAGITPKQRHSDLVRHLNHFAHRHVPALAPAPAPDSKKKKNQIQTSGPD